MSEELCYLPAVELLEQFRSRALSPVEVIGAVQARADEVEPRINAFAYRFDEGALAAATAAERRYRDGTARPLEGLPVAVKMDVDIAGQPGNLGSRVLADRIAETTALLPARILEQGGIVHARTATPEFLVASFTHTQLWGESRNPWRLDVSPGGSSGGSAASLAAGTAALATGGDSAGSIRMPACFCGVVGYKPPRGRVPLSDDQSFDQMVSAGPLARTVTDCAMFADAISGPDLGDPWSLPPSPPLVPVPGRIDALAVAVAPTLGGFPVEPEIAALTSAAAHRLGDRGARVSECEPGWNWQEVLDAGQMMLEFNNADAVDLPREMIMPYVAAFLDGIAAREVADLPRARKISHRWWQALREVFETSDVLIAPTQGLYAFDVGDSYVDHGPRIAGQEVRYPFQTHMGLPFNLFNSLPVLTVPIALTSAGVPTGVQVIGRPYAEESVFRVGLALEQTRGEVFSYSSPDSRPAFG
jgi:Asp-tRNA(Asn)/Glu-tRNA(Gln) amidotransferase A subunit family amidase